MATYAIGDIQGCFKPFQALLSQVGFDPGCCRLWLTGDLVNRGPQSLEVLRWVYEHRSVITMVLGNHDLHLLAVAAGVQSLSPEDTLSEILDASDAGVLLDWLRTQPLLYHDDDFCLTLVHAGLAPQWDLKQAQSLAHEVESVLRGGEYYKLFENMYGDTPTRWDDQLQGWGRLRLIINYFTRMRYCDREGHLILGNEGGGQRQVRVPWFQAPGHKHDDLVILFGHWAALNGQLPEAQLAKRLIPLDTGCVWGNRLTAIRLEDRRIFQVQCSSG